MSDPRVRIVAEGYDAIADGFAEWRDRIAGDPRRWWADQLSSRLPDGARVLELGCGAALPDTRLLAQRFHVYVLNHVPRDLLAPLFARIHSWLDPGGYFLSAFGTSDTEAWVGEWLGTTMFFSSFPPETTRRVLAEAGFELVLDEIGRMTEPMPDGDVAFHWVLALR
jgi:hypothetical protein